VSVGFFPGVDIDEVKHNVKMAMQGRVAELGLGLDIRYRGFHANGAVLLPKYINGTGQDDASGINDGSRLLQRDFFKTIPRCNCLAASLSTGDGCEAATAKEPPDELQLRPVRCKTDTRFYLSLFQDPSRVVVMCYGPEATNIHGVNKSVSLESFGDVVVTTALFVWDRCGLVKEK
jgi:acetylornithine deacetylase